LFSVGLLGFVGFVVNYRSTDGASVSEKELLFVRLRVRKITFFRVPKNQLFIKYGGGAGKDEMYLKKYVLWIL
jgi:hypothetical protein